MSIDVKAVRDRALHYLTPDVAASIGLTLQQLQQFVSGGTQTLSEDQLQRLAVRIEIEESKYDD
jgi:hypothetical protein